MKYKGNVELTEYPLSLGKNVWIVSRGLWLQVKLIKVTKCGYNLLDETQNRCVLKRHLYPTKKTRGKMDMQFIISVQLAQCLCKKTHPYMKKSPPYSPIPLMFF